MIFLSSLAEITDKFTQMKQMAQIFFEHESHE